MLTRSSITDMLQVMTDTAAFYPAGKPVGLDDYMSAVRSRLIAYYRKQEYDRFEDRLNDRLKAMTFDGPMEECLLARRLEQFQSSESAA